MNPIMLISPETSWPVIGFGLVIGNTILSWLAAIVLGGFKMGSLERCVTLSVSRAQYDAFWQTMQQRLAELGFRAGSGVGVYVQSGSEFGNMATFTHAKTKKELRVTVDIDGGVITVALSLRYLDPIVGDSGESAYRDAVLDYVSSQTDAMEIVPNRSFGAISSFLGGLLACAAVFVLKLVGFKPVVPPILVLASTEITVAILALISIRQKPRELIGQWLAIVGIILSLSAVLAAIAL